MFSRPVVTIPTALLAQINVTMQKSPVLMQTAFDRNTRNLRRRIVVTLATPVSAHRRPTEWQSDKQRRWWFAVGRKRWSGRTGRLGKGWKTSLKTTNAGGLFTVYNDDSAMPFVQGNRIQRMHKGTWRELDATVAQFQQEAELTTRETAFTVFDPFAGVR